MGSARASPFEAATSRVDASWLAHRCVRRAHRPLAALTTSATRSDQPHAVNRNGNSALQLASSCRWISALPAKGIVTGWPGLSEAGPRGA
jgi:hypothetical protein